MFIVLYVWLFHVKCIISGKNEYIADNHEYISKKNVKSRWNSEVSEKYTSSFNMTTHMTHVTQDIIDVLNMEMKNVFFIQLPAEITGMYKELKHKSNTFVGKPRRHGRNARYDNNCELLRVFKNTLYSEDICGAQTPNISQTCSNV